MNCLHIIFSKDRALQLRAQLSSIKEFVKGDVEQVILYHPSPDHEDSYKQVISEFPEFKFMRQTNFRTDVQTLLYELGAPYVFFTPDDGLFIRETDLDTMATHENIRDYIFSLRLGSHLTESHPVGRKKQALPEFLTNKGGRLTFDWTGELDWQYPLALDGHIFDTKQILAIGS